MPADTPDKTPQKKGAKFYTSQGDLKPILVYVPTEIHEKLKEIAIEEDRSLQKTVKRILTQHVKKNKKEN